ncbi:MAG: tetratricopeptide repeat protein [Bacteroidia bacterium]|nr:tetratricopeptide repeat protein [Bacteroidia bacterium]
MLARFLLLLLPAMFPLLLTAQSKPKADSLIRLLGSLAEDAKKVKMLTDISYHLQNSEPKLAFEYGKMAEELALRIGDTVGLAQSYENFGMIHEGKGMYPEALRWYEKSLKLLHLKGGKGIASVLHNMGVVYLYQGDYKNALEKFLEAARINAESKNDLGLTQNYNNIGLVHQYLKEYPSAETYFLKCMELAGKGGDSVNFAFAIGNLALNHYYAEDYKKYFEYSARAVRVFQNIGDKVQIGNILTNNGAVYNDMGDYTKAREYFQMGANVYKELGDLRAYGAGMNNIGESYISEKNFKAALLYVEEGLKLARATGSRRDVVHAYSSLIKIYRGLGDYKKALDVQTGLIALNDSILNETKTKEMADLSARFDLEKKQQEIDFLSKERMLGEEKIAQKSRANILLMLGIVLFMILLGLVMYRLFEKRKANRLLEEKNKIIEEKSKDITDSINYARRIQSAIQPPPEVLRSFFPECFILQRPRDIVSGDFYWVYKYGSKVIVAVADCTGHGVPGALMSMVGLNFLEETVKEHPGRTPEDLLNLLHAKVVSALNKDVTQRSSMDGMDVALICFDLAQSTFQFAGAVRPVVFVSEGRSEVIKGDRYSVGGVKDLETAFTGHHKAFRKGDMVYVFSDGYADQFGGDSGKKFMLRKFYQLVESYSALPADVQEKKLLSDFESWKGKQHQTDDVLVIGIRL